MDATLVAPHTTPRQDWFASWFDSEHYHALYAHRDEQEAAGFVDALLTRHRLFGVLQINEEAGGVSFVIGCRNSHDKTFALGLTVGYRVFVCDNLAFHGEFTPVTRKHTKNFDYLEVIGGAVDKMQRHFGPMVRQIEVWKGFDLPDVRAKEIIYQAFIACELDVPKHLAKVVHHNYFEPELEDFKARNLWSLSNAFTSAFKTLDAVPRMQATARLAPFMASVR